MPSKNRTPKSQARISSEAEYRRLPIHLLDDPAAPSRATLDERKLEDLIESIAAVGLLEPLIVQATGERWRVLAGHRRLLACRALQLATVPCVVRQPGPVSSQAVTMHENAYREDLNPAEEAAFFSRLLDTEAEGDVDKLCELLRVNRGYVEGRLALHAGDQRVLAELADGRITIGVARELNLVQDAGIRLSYLDAAAKGGASVTMVKEWRIKANILHGDQSPVSADQLPAGGVERVPPELHMECFLCQDASDYYDMELLYVHRRCRKIFLDRILEQVASGARKVEV